MKKTTARAGLLATTTLAGAACLAFAGPAAGQTTQPIPPASQNATADDGDTIIVTGSRIRRSVASTPAPVTTLGAENISDRGYVSAAQALNDITALDPQLNQAPGSGASSGPGQQFPSLFGLGTGRTLTLVNGRRFVTSSSGLGDAQVDANIIPVGLIERIEVVQAGGAAVYGSDAIAGVVNYILKDDFEGIEIDGLTSVSDRGDYWTKSLRGTFGLNFADGRGNAALNAEWSESPILEFRDRPLTNLSRITTGNPEDTGPNDGIPSVREVMPAHFWPFNSNGVIYTIPAPAPLPPCGGQICFLRQDGQPLQFSPDGSVVPYDPGVIMGIPFAKGGDGFRFSDLAGLRTGVERVATNAIGRYDITDRVRFSAELLFARTTGSFRPQGFARTVLSPAPLNAIPFTISNPFLTPEAINALTAASPGFAFGAPLFLSKDFYFDLFPATVEAKTDTYRALAALEGDFDLGDRNLYWSVSASYGRVEGQERGFGVHNAHFSNALAAVDSGGQIVCAINADADPTNDDPACAPLDPFGFNRASQAARDYVMVDTGQDFTNEQIDVLATIGATLFTLPTGEVKAVLAYEHRDEQAKFVPLPANQLGLTGTGNTVAPDSGGYNTDEISVEALLPLIGDRVTLPFAQLIELNGVYRYVDNSIAGGESVWSAGARWQVVDDLTVRATRSRNFRAPTLTQLLAPNNVILTQAGIDPCDADRIDSGPNPEVRRANCEAEWAANPQYGDLATFQDPAENFVHTEVTEGGNPDLRNEISDTWTYGFVFEPRFIPGLTFSFDRLEIDLTDGLSPFTTADFMATCYDSSPQPAEICSQFERLAESDGVRPAGTVIRGRTTTFNAGVVQFRGEVYFLNYDVPLDRLFSSGDPGRLSVSIEATHTSLLTTSVTGAAFTRTDNTVQQPDWVGRLNAVYSKGPLRLTYQANYLSKVLAGPDATIENNPNPVIAANATHAVSGQYDFGPVVLRAGVTNLTDKAPSYPNFAHGDILGRRFFFGATARF
ncbi:TonB-dependent receptor domain-containing protein [Amphiplicatus metriothermophilus]|uniref:TonB-dependent Receptor Plug Domain n=1 Tax=Amphiplicatus metriothermophilus TaxID=1519374 RepID=A0A239PVI6_9PROT|nr:TonB-dependent receptor [Amphiplicatus metriothermophilus]MBB5519564.1 outer membrane receptor protein involved in Fe transport [Amphiplicatus metriothermophilus]SNT74128.1 TonB-dependent Receptor Plug Domain [Amphiplicatus metriothermophilus]